MRVLKRQQPQAKFSGLFDNILGAVGLGVQVAGQTGLLAPKAPKPKGCTMVGVYTQGEAAACLDGIWAEYGKVKGQLSAADRLQYAQAIKGILNDSKVWRTPLETADANTYLNNIKAFFDGEIASAQTALTGGAVSTTTGAGVITAATPVAQTPVAGGNVVNVAGISVPQNTLVYGGIGLLALLVVLSKK